MNMVIGQVPFLRSFRSILRVKKKRGRGQYPISVSTATVTGQVREGRIILFALVANQNTGFTTSFQLKELFI